MRKGSISDQYQSLIQCLKPLGKGIIVIYILLFVQVIFYGDYPLGVYIIFGCMAFVIAVYGIRKNNSVRQPTSIKNRWLAFVCGCLILTFGIYLRYYWTGDSPILHAYRTTPIPRLIYTCLIAPIGEEVIYRQLLYSDWFGDHPLGLFVSGALFIAIHFPSTIHAFVFYTIATIGLFVAYEKSGKDITVSMAVHIANNVFAFI